MRPQDIILRKRDGFELTEEEIDFMVMGYTLNKIPDYQMSSFLMAIYFRGMTDDEIYYLTKSMLNSGDIITFDEIEGLKVDKHSTGGVGDKTTFVVGSILAASGINVCKMSGRGLGYTGGTIDKLESIPGFNVYLNEEEFIDIVKKNKFSIIGQTKNIALADKKIYALRDVTGTVASIPLIASSIMSKKLAIKTDLISLDIKVGNGAFMKDLNEARLLAKTMIKIGEKFNRKVISTLTSMDENLGYAIGNSLEIIEAIDTLKGKGPKDFYELCIQISANTIYALGLTKTLEDALELAQEKIYNGSAFNHFKEMVLLQGGNISYIDNPTLFEKPKYIIPLYSKEEGYVSLIDTKSLGLASMMLGAGRVSLGDNINHRVGLKFYPKIGDYIKKGDLISEIYSDANDNNILELVNNSYKLTKEKNDFKLILDVLS